MCFVAKSNCLILARITSNCNLCFNITVNCTHVYTWNDNIYLKLWSAIPHPHPVYIIKKNCFVLVNFQIHVCEFLFFCIGIVFSIAISTYIYIYIYIWILVLKIYSSIITFDSLRFMLGILYVRLNSISYERLSVTLSCVQLSISFLRHCSSVSYDFVILYRTCNLVILSRTYDYVTYVISGIKHFFPTGGNAVLYYYNVIKIYYPLVYNVITL